MAKTLYDTLIALPSYSALAGYPGISTAALVTARKQIAETCNAFAVIADGPRWIPTATKTSAYSAAAWELVKYNPTGGAFAITLPNPTTIQPGVCIRLKNVSTSTNVVTVSAAGGSTIDGLASITQAKGIQCVEYICDGTNWMLAVAYNE
jgi:hypothetical protein